MLLSGRGAGQLGGAASTVVSASAQLSFSLEGEGEGEGNAAGERVRGDYLAVCWSRSVLGYALYRKDEGAVVVAECREFDSFLNLQELKETAGPGVIVVPTGADPRFMAAAKEPLGSGRAPEVAVALPADFTPANATAKLAEVQGLASAEDGEAYLAQRVDPSAAQSICALGGLLARVCGVGAVRSLRTESLTRTLAIDPKSLQALQVFKRVAHPSAHNGIGSAKEGLSLFGLLNVCKTKMGSETLRRWLQSPTQRLDVLEARHRAVEVLSLPHNQELMASLREHLRFWRDPADLLKSFQGYSATVKHWQSLFQTLYTYPAIVDLCRKLEGGSGCACFARVGETFDEPRIAALFKTLHHAVDLPMSHHARRVVIKWGVDDALDRHKEAFDGLGNFLEEVAKVVVEELGPLGSPVSVDYYPQLGYFTTVGVGYFEAHLTTDLPADGYDFQFKSDEKLFYKSARMRELDAKYGDIYSAIVDMEAEVILEPANQNALLAGRCLGEVDCLAAMALIAREEQWVRPTMVPSTALRIIDGRHPLQERCVDRFVPNDTHAGAEEGRVHIVTGPNASGKSVYLKQVAVCVYLAHVGSFVPAKEATIGTTDRIFTRIVSRGTAVADGPCSSFSSDLEDVKAMLRYSTERSLLVIDEFGKGTVAADGIALLAAVARRFLNERGGCPKVFLSTHFTEILEDGLVPQPHPRLHLSHMAVESVDDAAGDHLLFRFKVQGGLSRTHFATYCAARAGVPAEVTARARFVLAAMKQKLPQAVLQRLLLHGDAAESARLRPVLRALPDDVGPCGIAALRAAVAAAGKETSDEQAAG